MEAFNLCPHSVRRKIQYGISRELIAIVLRFGRKTRAKFGRFKYDLDPRDVDSTIPDLYKAYRVVVAGRTVVSCFPLRSFATFADGISPEERAMLIALKPSLKR